MNEDDKIKEEQVQEEQISAEMQEQQNEPVPETVNETKEKVEELDEPNEQPGQEVSKDEESEDKQEDIQDNEDEKKSNEEDSENNSDEVVDAPDNTTESTEEEPIVDTEKEELRAKLEELEFEREENVATVEYNKLVHNKEQELGQFQQAVQQTMLEGMKAYGIDPNKTFQELQQQDPMKAELARQFVEHAQKRIDDAMAQAQQEVERAGADIVFKRAEREIKKFGLSPEQEIKAAETFVDIVQATGMQDLKEDLKTKVRLAVGQAKLDLPDEVKIQKPDTVKEANDEGKVINQEETDTKTSKLPTEEMKQDEPKEVGANPVEPPVPVQQVNIDDYKASATGDGSIDTVANPNAITPENVLEKLKELPYKERVNFMLENYEMYEEAMRRQA